jgi:polyhydroxyalkanoate synthesis repressor PhaR
MPRLIKRYGSRKLYDTENSSYVSLEELAGWIREGQQLQVVDNKSGDDVTATILTQIISEEGRKGKSILSTGFLHDLIRIGETTLKAGEEAVGKAKDGATEFVHRSISKLKPAAPISDARAEMASLRERLDALEAALGEINEEPSE